jgi:tetratricopeptide (TPR) repeat protein
MIDVQRRLSFLLAAVGLVSCCGAAWYSARAGASRLLSETAPRLAFTDYESQALPLADDAVRLSPSDPEAHYARAAALAQEGDAGAAVAELERVAELRPRYYQTWLKLGRARERAGDAGGALGAYRESVRLAPLYAEPRWQLGNTLLREGSLDEAFAELRRAAASRPQLLPYTLELAWHAYGGDARSVERAVAPQTDGARVALARFFARHGRAEDALALWHEAKGGAGDEERRALVADLIAAGKFREAHAVWTVDSKNAGSKDAGSVDNDSMTDGGFESQEGGDEQGFGWRFAPKAARVAVSLDQSSPHGGARSLLLKFDGSPDTNTRFASQLAVAESDAHYRLRFAARAENLVSGATPVVSVLSAVGDRVLAQSAPLPRDTTGWREYELEFTAPDDAVLIVIRRPGCEAPACPIFGRAWFDDFTLRKL